MTGVHRAVRRKMSLCLFGTLLVCEQGFGQWCRHAGAAAALCTACTQGCTACCRYALALVARVAVVKGAPKFPYNSVRRAPAGLCKVWALPLWLMLVPDTASCRMRRQDQDNAAA